MRLLDKEALADQLSIAAGNGNIDKINALIEGGADINARSAAGISPLAAANIGGRDEVAQLLLKKGAREEPPPSAETLLDAMYASLKKQRSAGHCSADG